MALSTTYSGIEIEYDEFADVWSFELYGTKRRAQSLSDAKKKIDSPPPKEKRSFKPVKAYLKNYRGIAEITVTSEDEDGKHFWIKDAKSSRSKESKSYVFVHGPANAALIEEVRGYVLAKKKLDDRIDAAYSQLTPLISLAMAD